MVRDRRVIDVKVANFRSKRPRSARDKIKEADKRRKQVEWTAYKIDGKLSTGERIRRRGEFDAKTRRGEETDGELRALSSPQTRRRMEACTRTKEERRDIQILS